MQLNGNDWKVRWYRWCLTHLVLVPGRGGIYGRHYNSTSLCVFVWTAFWVPLGLAVGGSFIAYFVWALFSDSYLRHGWLGVFAPVFFILGLAVLLMLLFGVVWLLFKLPETSVGSMAVSYVKALKDRVCPLVKID